jgi:hypothetical protein
MSGFSPKLEELKKSSPHYILKVFSDFAVVLPLLLLQFVACLDFFCGLHESHVDTMTTLPIGPPVACAEQIHR